MAKSRIETLLQTRTDDRRRAAAARAEEALIGLERAGFRAWLVGSLAKRTFALHSDVDLLVECEAAAEPRVFRIVEAVMKELPFHVIPSGDLDREELSSFLKDAVDASRVRACA